MTTKEEVLEYARECKRLRPQITDDELRVLLEAKFISGVNPFTELAAPVTVLGAVANPLHWFVGLSSIFRRIHRLWATSGKDIAGIKDIIDGVVIIIREEPAGSS